MFYKIVEQTIQRNAEREFLPVYKSIYPNTVLSDSELLEIAQYEIDAKIRRT